MDYLQYKDYLSHSKGPWKKHKYIKKIGNRYIYGKSGNREDMDKERWLNADNGVVSGPGRGKNGDSYSKLDDWLGRDEHDYANYKYRQYSNAVAKENYSSDARHTKEREEAGKQYLNAINAYEKTPMGRVGRAKNTIAKGLEYISSALSKKASSLRNSNSSYLYDKSDPLHDPNLKKKAYK